MTARQSYHLTFARFSPSLSVKSFTASEAANTAYRVEITATSTDSSLPLSSYLNQRAAFEIRPQEDVLSEVAAAFSAGSDESPAKQWQGIVTSCEKLSVSKDETVYRFVLEPRFAALKHFQSSRLFQNQTVPDIVAAVFKHHGFSGVDYRFQKSRSYTVREYVTQYLESDFDFINRLCEEEGIWYAFEQHEQHGDVVVFGDSPEHYFRDPSLPVSYRPHAGLESTGTEALFNLSIRHNPIVEGIRSADYNYRTADTDLFAETDNKQSEESADNTVLLGKQQNWGLHPKTPDEAKVQTTLLNEAVLCRQTVANGSGNVVSMAPMKVFQTDTAFPEAPDGWLVLSMEHSGSRDTAYSHTFTAIPAQLAFRPERTTPRPHIAGTLPARVTAAENCTYAYIDDMGRYRVKLPFDLDEWSPGGESRPVRLAKPYAGPEYGIHFPLHEGTEVMLSFVQGNPDRPYISGVMHDSAHPDHIPADWNTRNVIRTWANNKLRMEDQKGQEHIKLATDYQKSQLNLGHIVDSSREKRGENGEGFELRTDGWGAVRAGKGILVSSDTQGGAKGEVLEMGKAIRRMRKALVAAKLLDTAAKRAGNTATESIAQANHINSNLKKLKKSGIVISAPDGLAASTKQSILNTAQGHIHWVSMQDSNISAGKNFTAHALKSINLFAQNKAVKIHAAQGKIEIQAKNNKMQIDAKKDLELTSSTAKVMIVGKDEVMISGGGGSYIKLKNGEIILASPKIVRVKAPAMPVGGSDSFFFNGFAKTDKTCIPCKIAELIGRPVNPISGIKVLPDETDFAFDGLVPFVWSRSYFSDLEESWLGSGWRTTLSAKLERKDGRFTYTDNQGRTFDLPELEEDEGQVLFEAEQIIFERIDNGSYQISNLDGSSRHRFSPLHLNDTDRSGSGNGTYALTQVSDHHGNGYRIVYNEDTGLPHTVIDELGREIWFEFDNLSPLTQIPVYRLTSMGSYNDNLPEGRELLVRYRYDDNGDLVAVEDAEGFVHRRFGYRRHMMIRHQTTAGLNTYYQYDHYTPQGRVLRSYTDNGEEWRFAYADGHTQITDALGRSEHLYYDHHGEVVKKVFADGSSVLTERDALGRPIKITDEMGRETRYRYNECGLLTFVGGEGGQNQHIRYDQERRPVEITLPHNQKTLIEYNEQGLPATQSDSKGNTTRYRYNENGQITQITDAKNNTYTFEYDQHHRLNTQTDCSGQQTRYTYNEEGKLESITDAAGHTTHYHYQNRKPLRIDYPDGSSEYFSYDHAGRLSVLTDAEGNRTAYDYDNDSKPTIRYNALGDAFQYRYDSVGRLKTLVNENGDSYTFEYDERDRLIRETGFDGKMTRYTYNPAGELIREEEYASGNIDVRTRPIRTITYHRDRIGRIRQKDSHLDGGEILSTHYRYDKLNRLIQAHNAHSELRFGYDHNGLVKEQLIHLDEPLTSGISRSQSKDVAAQITEHRYDVLGNRTQTILPTGEVLNRLYYGSGHLHHINLDGTTLADIERDALHRPIERTIGKLNTQFQLDPLGRLKQQITQPNSHNKADPAVLIGRRYQYDTTGNLVRTDDQTNGSRDYTYDALGRISQSADEHYRYDPAHNLTDGSRISGNRLTQYKGISYRYDPLGNLIEKQQHDGEIQHYRYNADNQLAEAEIHRPGQNAVLYRYRYDPIGRRIAKVHPDGNEIQYLWDGSRLLQEYRKDRTYTYVYTEDQNYELLAQITTYNGSDKARKILYYHNDQIGIPREITDEEGNIVWSGDYSGWGKLTQEGRLKLDIHQPFRLQNQHYDEETGLHYNFFRYYDPEIGRFTQQDPIGLMGGGNLYQFAPNTMQWVDVLGLCRCKRPSSQSFWSNYPNYTSHETSDVWNAIGGSIGSNYQGENSCAARVSYGLNKSGASIPSNRKYQTNKNSGGTDGRYIISAAKMRKYLKETWGHNPKDTIKPGKDNDLAELRNKLQPGQVAIVASDRHVAVVTDRNSKYSDPYVSAFGGDYWILPMEKCSC